jgi:para-nitrobenzyl esterase
MKSKILFVIITIISIIVLYGCRQNTVSLSLDDLKLGFYKTPIEFLETSLNEEFSPDLYEYTSRLDQSYTDSVFVTPVLAPDASGMIKINGSEAVSGEPFKIELQPGENIMDITVSGKRRTIRNYKLTIRQEDLSAVYTSEVVEPGIWRIDDFGGSPGNENMYLVEGKDKALLFDTGMGKGDLVAFLKTLTQLPIEVAITHGHGDHIAQLDQFTGSRVYMSKADESRLPDGLDKSKFNWIREGDIIDIGAGRKFEVVGLAGHSLGSVVFLDSQNKIAVVGDAVSSGAMVYMFSATSAPLATYHESLKKVEEKIKDLDGLTLLSGHQYQEKVPLTGAAGKQLFTDMRIISEKVLNGEVVGELAYQTRGGVKTELRQAYYGLAGLWYNPNNLGK